MIYVLFLLELRPRNGVQPLQGMRLQEQEKIREKNIEKLFRKIPNI